MRDGVRCMLMRGGTSKGAYFLEEDLPDDRAERDDLLLRIMGSPDSRQIDGIGGAHPLTSKVAIVGPSTSRDADVSYLFLQVGVDQPTVSDQQNCGNILAGVGPFAVERGLVTASGEQATVRIHMRNTDSHAIATFPLADGRPHYEGATAIAGVPGTAAPIQLDFVGIAGSSTGALLPTGNRVDHIEGVACTLVDNGMPVVVLPAAAMGITGHETCDELEANAQLRARLERIRLEAGQRMGLGDVEHMTVPKMTMVAAPRHGGTLATRTFIPHRCHDAIGVLGAVSVATATVLSGTPAAELAGPRDGDTIALEHPTGNFAAVVALTENTGDSPSVARAGILRTARNLMDGQVFARTTSGLKG